MNLSTTTLFILLSTLSIEKGQASEGYVLAENNKKCPFQNGERLFRIEGQSVSSCHDLCYNTEGCKYFSIGITSYPGVCMGCTEKAVFDNHEGFDAYELTELQNFPTASPIPASSCLADADTFTTDGCDYASFVEGLNEYLAGSYCAHHTAEDVLQSLFPGTSEEVVNGVCAEAWDQMPSSTFQDVDDRFTDDFMEEYILGDTFLNHETGTFQGTVEGENIDRFRDAEATSTVLQAIPSMSTCSNNAIMCCFGRDRQPNDNNGNCHDPIETNCRHADPADNSNLCWTDTDIPTFSDPFAFPGKSEGPIHCHGLAWDEDENSFLTQLRFNNFFYVSLYDHMYTRGYVEPTVDSDNIGMCDCVENLPLVSRADCTQVDATQTFTISFNNGGFTAIKSGEMDVQFNSCRGINPGNGDRKDNDLGSYVYRLNKEGKLSDAKMEGVFETLVGYESPNDNQNEAACESAYLEVFAEDYPDDVANLKCPYQDAERLFRTSDNDPLTLEECQAKCYETENCEYFSLGVSARGDHKGVCIGCTSNAILEAHHGFNSYQMTSTQVFPTASPTATPPYRLLELNKKCPYANSGRLFRTPDSDPQTLRECFDICNAHPTCEYFTLGQGNNLRDEWKGVCMGCTSDVVLDSHTGFNTYVISP